MNRSLIFLAFAFSLPGYGAPAINKVEPPNWWTSHSHNPIQVLLTGSDLAGAAVTTAAKGFRIEVRQASANGHYLFISLDIAKSVKPGVYPFQVKGSSGATSFDFRLDAPVDTKGRFQHITSDDVIYLLMPDRFANGDASNDSPAGLGAAANRDVVNAYHGGDLKGIREHLPYLKELGITGVWLTPVYQNSSVGGAPYHGYHAVDFYAPEPRFGSMAEYRQLVDEAHRLGIKMVQDQVANHTGPRHPWVKDPPTPTWFNGLDTVPHTRNNFDIAGLADPYARPSRKQITLEGWFSGQLPDLNQRDPLVTDYLIENTLWWIGMTGVDGIRQDTYPYVDRPFWEQWQSAIDLQYPGFFVTGEVTASTPAVLSFFEGGTRREGADTKLPSLLDFPLEGTIRKVFAQGQPFKQLPDILAGDSLFRHPENLVSFIGNHDQPRFLTLAGGDVKKLMMGYAFLLTTPRIPHLYYGDEIAMGAGADRTDLTIRADFPEAAFAEAGRTGDAAVVSDFLRELLRFRAGSNAVRHGQMVELLTGDERYAYLRRSGDEVVVVILNRAGSATPVEVDLGDLGLPPGLHLTRYDAAEALEINAGKAVWRSPEAIGIFRN